MLRNNISDLQKCQLTSPKSAGTFIFEEIVGEVFILGDFAKNKDCLCFQICV